MSPTKDELLDEAKAAGKVPSDAEPDSFKKSELESLVDPDAPLWEGSASATEPIIAADGHVVLSQEDIDARK
jgi:hypothetical protein